MSTKSVTTPSKTVAGPMWTALDSSDRSVAARTTHWAESTAPWSWPTWRRRREQWWNGSAA
eukprot:3452376-Alexandrium_andersonii.AAC.1